MTGALFDWQEWILALVTGAVGAFGYEQLASWRHRREWRETRDRVLHDTWIEAVWPYVAAKMDAGWADVAAANDDGVYAGHIAELQSIIAKSGPHSVQLPWALLTPAEQRLVQSVLAGLVPLAKAVMPHVDVMLTHYALLWTNEDRRLLLAARRRVARLAAWDPPKIIPKERFNSEMYIGVALSLDGLHGFNDLAKWAQNNLPEGKRPPLPTSNIREL